MKKLKLKTLWVLRGLGDWYNYAHILRAARNANFFPRLLLSTRRPPLPKIRKE